MPFDLDHWKKPRATIANVHEKNDIAYATHGALMAGLALKALNLLPQAAAGMRLIDYGCGTARIARVFSGHFGHVTAYDPVPECIAVGRTECPGMTFPNLDLTDDWATVQPAHHAACINVIEHLADADAQVLIDRIRSKLLPGGMVAMWYCVTRNAAVMAPLLTAEQRAEDAAARVGSINVRAIRLA
jgi:2-polyprenyl-3-methyl-5-hydroxy-6-metoxy-1,4-benzoquinol methylase